MKKYDYLVVGAGLFGSTIARMLKDNGFKVIIVEKRKHPGGNIYDAKQRGIIVHKYGPHIFHTSNKTVWNFVNRFAEFIPFINSPIANYDGDIYSLPFNMYTFNKMWGVTIPAEAKAIIDKQRKEIVGEPKNLEEQAISLVGRDIYEKLIKGYTEKQWGRDCKDLPASIIKRLPVRFDYNNNYFNDIYQGIPRYGYTDFVENMLEGIDVIFSLDYLKHKDKCDGHADNIIYTGKLDEYFGCVFGKLQYRTVRFVEEHYYIDNLQGNAVVNYTRKDVPYTRIIEHKHFMPSDLKSKIKDTIITREFPCEYIDNEECYYPINDAYNESLRSKYLELTLCEYNVYFGGRLAEYKYYDMDDVILRAFELAGELGVSNV